MNAFEGHSDQVEACEYFSAIDRDGISMDLHECLLVGFGDLDRHLLNSLRIDMATQRRFHENVLFAK